MIHSPSRAIALLLVFVSSAATWSNGADSGALPADLAGSASTRFTEIQREYIHSWIHQAVPACPRELASTAVEQFLEELRRSSPRDLEQLLSPEFPVQKYRSLVLQRVGAQLSGPAHAALREEVGRLRVQAIMEKEGDGKSPRAKEASVAVARIKTMAPVYPRRLFEGRMDDDEVVLLLKKVREPDAAPAVVVPVKPKEVTAADIASEYARRNQEGAAAQKLRALTLEFELKTPAGETLTMFLYRLRPDRFRMAVLSGGATRTITAFDGAKYWQLVAGRPRREIPAKAIGELRYLGEFVDPLFAESGARFERLPDGSDGESKFFRLNVRRPDGSGHVAWIDRESYRQVGRETPEKQVIRYSDFRPVGGITLAFREELTDADGKKTVLTVLRATPDPGLIQAFFEPPEAGKPDFFELEQALVRPALAATK